METRIERGDEITRGVLDKVALREGVGADDAHDLDGAGERVGESQDVAVERARDLNRDIEADLSADENGDRIKLSAHDWLLRQSGGR